MSSGSHQHRGQCFWRELLRSSLNDFRGGQDSTLSAFQLLSSVLVQARLQLLSLAGLDDYLQVLKEFIMLS